MRLQYIHPQGNGLTALLKLLGDANSTGEEAGNTVKVEIHILQARVAVTHATKDAVMSGISPADKRAVGCKNPDIHVVSSKDDRIVLTRPKLMGKGKKQITNVHAAKVLGANWPSLINPISFVSSPRLRKFQDEQERGITEDFGSHGFDLIAFIRKGPDEWIAVPLRASN